MSYIKNVGNIVNAYVNCLGDKFSKSNKLWWQMLEYIKYLQKELLANFQW